MNNALHAALVRVAIDQKTIFYGEIAPTVDLNMRNPGHRKEIGRLLGEISEHEHAEGRPLLSVLVISRRHKKPGAGFFNLASKLGRFTDPAKVDATDEAERTEVEREASKSSAEEDAFYRAERERVHAAWKKKRRR